MSVSYHGGLSAAGQQEARRQEEGAKRTTVKPRSSSTPRERTDGARPWSAGMKDFLVFFIIVCFMHGISSPVEK